MRAGFRQENSCCFVFRENMLLVKAEALNAFAADSCAADEKNSCRTEEALLPSAADICVLNKNGGIADSFFEPEHCLTAVLAEKNAAAPASFEWIPIRGIFAAHDNFADRAARAAALLNWRSRMRFCPSCGALLADDETETAKKCTHGCGLFYPRISPAVIVLVRKKNDILLVHHANRANKIYTCVSGFLEPGETAEQCAAREVKEETGIDIKNIQYAATQSWPFPDQFMIAFRAEYASGELCLQLDEVDDAHWFDKNNLPQIPPPGSVAHNLITQMF